MKPGDTVKVFVIENVITEINNIQQTRYVFEGKIKTIYDNQALWIEGIEKRFIYLESSNTDHPHYVCDGMGAGGDGMDAMIYSNPEDEPAEWKGTRLFIYDGDGDYVEDGKPLKNEGCDWTGPNWNDRDENNNE